MLNFNDILSYYPKNLRIFKENILKEYLQYKILDIIYSTKYGEKLVFLGGTALRIVHNSIRFSEDIDFDNRGLNQSDFRKISKIVQEQLELEGYSVEIKTVFKGAYRCYIKFPELLYKHELSGYKKEKILIQLDTEPQKYEYNPSKFLINKFGIFRFISITPVSLLLSQKICTCIERKREKGRDFFDVVYLMAKTEPDYKYLKQRLGISCKKELIAGLKERSKGVNFKQLALDVEPFLFDPNQKSRVVYFSDWIKSMVSR